MTRSLSRKIFRIVFLICGVKAMLFGIATVALRLLLPVPDLPIQVLIAPILYLLLGGVCFYMVWRLKPAPIEAPRGFEVLQSRQDK